MVQFSIAYIALGCGLLFVLAGMLALRHRSTSRWLSQTQRTVVLGGLVGMAIFFLALIVWLR
jgi:hypothetical protein